MFSSNQQLLITGDYKNQLLETLQFVMKFCGSKSIEGFVQGDNRMSLYDHIADANSSKSEVKEFVPKMNVEAVVETIMEFLKEAKAENESWGFGDGAVHHGWKVYYDDKEENYRYGYICSIRPFKMFYHK